MLRAACLVLDHDDTVVQSTRQVHYPAFCRTLAQLRPQEHISEEEFTAACADPGFLELCRGRYGFTPEEMDFELRDWLDYANARVPDPYPGFERLLPAFHAAGGLICVISHSAESLIRRDYDRHFGLQPDGVYDLSFTPQKPDPAALLHWMKQTGLPPEQLLAVDDLPAGAQMAAAAGVAFCYAAYGQTAAATHRRMLRECERVLHDPAGLFPLLGLTDE